jgi:hypothetical protein
MEKYRNTGFLITMKDIMKAFLLGLALLTLATALGCYPVLKKEAQQPEVWEVP